MHVLKLILSLCMVTIMISGCADTHSLTDTSINDPSVIIIKADIDIDHAQSFLLNGGKMAYGVNAVNITEENIDPYDSGYVNDVILVEKEGKYGFYNYEGNVLLKPQFDSIDQNPWVIYASKGNQTYAIESDFTSFNDDLAGVGGAFPKITIENGKVISEVEPVPQNSDPETTYYLVDSDNGSGIIDQNNEVISLINGWYSCGASVLAGGYVFLSDTEWTYDYETDHEEHGELMLFDVTGKQILGSSAEDAGYMWNGYAPVKQNGKWGFIDENGQSQTEYIFDEASSLYDGKAYVKYKGQWIVLDIVDSLKNGKITQETMDLALGS